MTAQGGNRRERHGRNCDQFRRHHHRRHRRDLGDPGHSDGGPRHHGRDDRCRLHRVQLRKTHIMNGSLTSDNTNMIALYKLLGTPMVRVGANDVERCTWAGTGVAPSQPNGQPFTTKITTGGVDQFCGFLAATGSKAIYGVNFQYDNVALSSAEAAYVMSTCPSSIVGIEIGNEPDKFGSWADQQPTTRSSPTPSSPRQALCWLARPAPAKLT